MKATAAEPRRRVQILALRGAVFLCLALAFFDLLSTERASRASVVVAIDVSASVDPDVAIGGMRAPGATDFGWMRDLPPDTVVLPFGSRPGARLTLVELLAGKAIDHDDIADSTDIERALVAASSLLPKGVGEIRLVTDGVETTGDAEVAAAALAAGGRRLFTYAAPVPAEIWLDRLEVSDRAFAGDIVAIGAVVASTLDRPVAVQVSLEKDGVSTGRVVAVTIPPRRGDLPGRARIELSDRPRGTGRVEYTVRVESTDGVTGDDPRNDSSSAIVDVGGERMILFAAPADTPAPAVTGDEDGKFVVRRVTPPVSSERLDGAHAIIIRDLVSGSEGLDEDSQSRIVRAVRERGLGLITSGARSFHGPGGYEGAPLEEALPVRCRPRDRDRRTLVVLLDRSGSMEEGRKLALATSAVRALADVMPDEDRLGVLAFAEDVTVVSAPAPVSESRDDLDERLASIEARGETRLLDALESAWRLLERETGDRALFVVTDGKAQGDLAPLGDRFVEADIRVAAFLTGRDADVERLLPLVRGGENGRIATEVDPRFLEQLLRREWASGDLALLPSTVAAERGGVLGEVSSRLDGAATLAWARATARDSAEVGLRSERTGDPLLALHRFGEGRVVALLSGPGRDETPSFADPDLWGALLSWVAPPRVSDRWIEEAAWGEAGRLHVRVRAPGDPTEVGLLEVRWGGLSVPMRAETASVFRGALDPPSVVTGPLRLMEDGVERDHVFVSDERGRERRRYGIDRQRLARMARRGGGDLLAPDEVPDPLAGTRIPFTGGLFLPLAMALLVAERWLSRRGAIAAV